MRFGFVTCVELGLSCIEEIYAVGGELDLVVTLPDTAAQAKSGRVYLDKFCAAHEVDLVKSSNVNDVEVLESIQSHEIDWLFIIGWSQIARSEVLNAPARGVLGMHPTLLPIGRGRAAIPWAILKGLEETGVTLFQLDEGVDTGPILSQVRIPVEARETATTLYEKVSRAHQTLIQEAWPLLVSDSIRPQPQNHDIATVWPGRRPDDGALLPTMTAQEVDRMVRAVTRPYPGAFADVQGKRLRVWSGEPQLCQGGIQVPVANGAYTALDYEWDAGD